VLLVPPLEKVEKRSLLVNKKLRKRLPRRKRKLMTMLIFSETMMKKMK